MLAPFVVVIIGVDDNDDGGKKNFHEFSGTAALHRGPLCSVRRIPRSPSLTQTPDKVGYYFIFMLLLVSVALLFVVCFVVLTIVMYMNYSSTCRLYELR